MLKDKKNKSIILIITSVTLIVLAISLHYIFSLTYFVIFPLIIFAALIFLNRDIINKNKITKKGLLFASSSLLVGIGLSLNNSFTLPLLFIALLFFILSIKDSQYHV